MARSRSELPHWSAQRPDRTGKRDIKRGVEYAARAGYFTKGLIHATIGVLATMTALGFSGGRIVGTHSAIETLRSQPFGQAVLWAIAVGLVGYVVWRLVEAFADPEQRGQGTKALIRRLGLAISGLVYAGLAVFTVRLVTGSGAGGNQDQSQESTAAVMQYEWGIWVVALIGIGFIAVAAYQGYRAYATKFEQDWRTDQMSPVVRHWSVALSRFGIAARAVSFALIGWFFVQAAYRADPSEARGLDGALHEFYDEPHGAVWLALIGIGFICYGVYCALNAKYKQITP
jgi:hypothetical protein